MSLDLNFESIILLLFFIAPGFLFTRTYTAYRPRYYIAPNTFTQFILAVVGSALIHATILTGIAVGLVGYWLSAGRPAYSNLLNPTLVFSTNSLPTLAITIFGAILYLVVSLILARRFATFLGRRSLTNPPRFWHFIMGDDPPEPTLLWHTALQIEPLELDLIPPHVAIQMRSGEYFEGDLDRMRLVGDEENTVELALRNVFYRPGQPATLNDKNALFTQLISLPNQVLLLRSTDVLWLTRNDIPR